MRSEIGHRQRVKDRYRKEGLDNFEESHMLELLLFYAIPRRDTKSIARRLLDRFGSVASVMDASPEALQQVEGVGPNTAMFIKLVHDTGRYYMVNRDQNVVSFRDINDCGSYLVNFFHGKTHESVWLMCLDGRKKLLTCQKLCDGNGDEVSVSPRRIMEVALSVNASCVVLAHNHPGGDARPSRADIMATENLSSLLSAMGLVLVDHIVVAGGDFVSMRQSNTYVPQYSGYFG